MSVPPIPPGYRSVTPYLAVDGAARAIEFPAYQPIGPLCVDGPTGESGGACGGAA